MSLSSAFDGTALEATFVFCSLNAYQHLRTVPYVFSEAVVAVAPLVLLWVEVFCCSLVVLPLVDLVLLLMSPWDFLLGLPFFPVEDFEGVVFFPLELLEGVIFFSLEYFKEGVFLPLELLLGLLLFHPEVAVGVFFCAA